LGEVVDLFTNELKIDVIDSSKDLLGRTYEYCIAQFADYEGKKGGKFYMSSSIVKTIVAILKPFNNCRVYDPCCGFRVIIMTVANSQVNTRVLELLSKFKIKKMNRWCAV